MRLAFERLPGAGPDIARPAIEIVVAGSARTVAVLCLVDTGSLRNRFAPWVAELAGVDLTGVDEELVAVGGITTTSRTVTCGLRLDDFAWEASVAFCDPWPFDFQIVGQLGFLRWFRVVIDAADETFEVIPNIS